MKQHDDAPQPHELTSCIKQCVGTRQMLTSSELRLNGCNAKGLINGLHSVHTSGRPQVVLHQVAALQAG